MKFFAKQKNKACPAKLQRSRGFTLIETLVALSIFTSSILGLLIILSKGISDTGYAKRKIIASYLAQEGVEYVRNLRDTYVLYTTPTATGWTNFKEKLTTASCEMPNGCYFNADSLFSTFPDSNMPIANNSLFFLTACSSSTCAEAPLKYDSTNGVYGYTAGTDSGFIRKINVVITANEVKVSSTVSWVQGSGTYAMVFRENLFNWLE